MKAPLYTPEYCEANFGHHVGVCGSNRCLNCGMPLIDAKPVDDLVDGRRGEWMQMSTGRQFFPLDPRPEDFTISDIANGLALDCRYGGQGRIDRYYSVAEHSTHIAGYALRQGWAPKLSLAALLHDAPEAMLNDLTRAVKHAVGSAYERLEHSIGDVILRKYGCHMEALVGAKAIKDLDRRIVPLEKAAILRHQLAWAYDQFEALEGVTIECWPAPIAKAKFLFMYERICEIGGFQKEECIYE